MRNLVTLLLLLLTVGAFAQETSTDSKTILDVELEEVVVSSRVIDVAKVRETPIAVSTISGNDVLLKTGNLEFPEVMNKTPGVYATKQGGGYGDSRISLRGFDQRNTSFLINGQPVNDMENGWVYWSNWQGLTDVTSNIQIQRGLGATSLAVPSVGGTVSIFTKSAEKTEGGSLTQMVGNDGYIKTTAVYNTGVNDKGWSSSYLLTKWSGNGYIYNTSGAGWTYFAAVGYTPEGSAHSLNLSVLGAGQWHHQRDVWVSIRDYQNFGEDGIDRRWNTNGGTLNGEEYNLRRNFYNKPLATLNWDWDISDNVQLNTSIYGSAGRGGGTGPRGRNYYEGSIDMLPFRKDLTEHYLENGKGTRNADGTINYDAVVAHNSQYEIGSHNDRDYARDVLVRRASMNSHNWIGAISKLNIQKGKMRYSLGIDLRDYTGYHYRAMNDLLGLTQYASTGNQNLGTQFLDASDLVTAKPFRGTNIGDDEAKIAYYNIGFVKWAGVNGLVEYAGDKVTAVLQAGLSNQQFQREDRFANIDNPISDKANLGGGYLKGGINYNFTESFEIGYGYIGNKLRLNINAYNTNWGNRFVSRSLSNQQGVDGFAQFRNIDVTHKGIEAEATYRVGGTKLRGMLSIGDWTYTKDFEAELFDENQVSIGTGKLYTKGAKVGDAAQFVALIGLDQNLGSNIKVDLDYRFVDGLYADYSITDSAFTNPDNQGALQLPSYGLVDLGATFYAKNGWSLRANVNNLLDNTYIAESNSNIHADAGAVTWNGIDVRNSVWFGFGRTWNVSLKYKF
jgi:outer membrane receptor protein involved in Fe transport